MDAREQIAALREQPIVRLHPRLVEGASIWFQMAGYTYRDRDNMFRNTIIRNRLQNVLLEVNIGGEESKTGVAPEALWPLLDAAAAEEHIRVKGLMAIPPVNDDDAQNRRYLAEVYKLFVQAGERGYQNVQMETLSMGMSGDFENAIREGATLVRIGTAIYGERDYSKKV